MSDGSRTIENLLQNSSIQLYVIACNIRSAYNVGAILRTADGAGNTAVITTGYTPSPIHPKVDKTALGAAATVPWCEAQLEHLLAIKNVIHVGLELSPRAISLFEWEPPKMPIFLYIGNEVTGLDAELLMALPVLVQLPMNGAKNSLNVAEATSISIYELLRKRLA